MAVGRRSHGRNIWGLLLAVGAGGGPIAVALQAPRAQTAPRAKHIIVMIADGCGYAQTDAASCYVHGEPGRLIHQRFPVRYGMSTFPANGQGYDPCRAWADPEYVKQGVTDSAAAATAMACGVKTYNAAIGVDVHRRVVPNVWERAESLGRSTGVVTSVPWSHATPAGFVAHCLSRGSYERIAMDMLLRSRADVVMGCGHPGFDNSGKSVAGPDATAYRYVGGRALWEAVAAGTAGGDADGDGVADAWKLIGTKAEFLALATGETPRRVLGVAEAHDTLQQGRAGDGNAEPFAVPMNPNVPTLAEMALAALNVLDEDPDGFCLMIEGGAVDWAGHSNQSGRVIEEEIDFTHAVEAVVAWVEAHSNWQETLLIVTGDHETGYLTGPPGAARHAPVAGRGRGQLPVMEWHSTGHTNLLIPLYAKGDAAAQFAPLADETDPLRGAYVDNTEIAQVVRQALE